MNSNSSYSDDDDTTNSSINDNNISDNEEEEEEEEEEIEDFGEIKILPVDSAHNKLEDKLLPNSVISFYLGEFKKINGSSFVGSMAIHVLFGKFKYVSPTFKLGNSFSLNTVLKINILSKQRLPANITIFLYDKSHVRSRLIGAIIIPINEPDQIFYSITDHQFSVWDKKHKQVSSTSNIDFALSYRYYITSHTHSRRLLPATSIRTETNFAYPEETQQDFGPGDLILYNFPGRLAGLAKVKFGCIWSHCGLVVRVPNKWTGRPQLAVVELTHNREAFYDIYAEMPLYDGMSVFDLKERIHGAPGLEVWRAPFKWGKKGVDEAKVKNLERAVLRFHDKFVELLSDKKKFAVPSDINKLKFTDSEKAYIKSIKGDADNAAAFLDILSAMFCAKLLSESFKLSLNMSSFVDVQTLLSSGNFLQPVLLRSRPQFAGNIYWPFQEDPAKAKAKTTPKKPQQPQQKGQVNMALAGKTVSFSTNAKKESVLNDMKSLRPTYSTSRISPNSIKAGTLRSFKSISKVVARAQSTSPQQGQGQGNQWTPSPPPPPQQPQLLSPQSPVSPQQPWTTPSPPPQVQQPVSSQPPWTPQQPPQQAPPPSQQPQVQQPVSSQPPWTPQQQQPPQLPPPISPQQPWTPQQPPQLPPPISPQQPWIPQPQQQAPPPSQQQQFQLRPSLSVSLKNQQKNVNDELELINKILTIEENVINKLNYLSYCIPKIYEATCYGILKEFNELKADFSALRDIINNTGCDLNKENLAKAQEKTVKHKKLCKDYDRLVKTLNKFKREQEPSIRKQSSDLDNLLNSIPQFINYLYNNSGYMLESAKERGYEIYSDTRNIYKTLCGAKQYLIIYRIPLPPTLYDRVGIDVARYKRYTDEVNSLFPPR